MPETTPIDNENQHNPIPNPPLAQPDIALRITGVKINYYHICKTKLWLFSHNITMEKEHQNVQMGKFLHEQHYKREKRNLQFDDMAFDFVRTSKGIEIHEVKKSRAVEKAHIAQMKYYLYTLERSGVTAEGILNYPTLRKTEKVSLTTDDRTEIENTIRSIDTIVKRPMPPPNREKICLKCAYFEYCFSGEVEEIE